MRKKYLPKIELKCAPKNFLIHIFEIMNEKKRKKEKNMSKKNIPIEKLDVFC